MLEAARMDSNRLFCSNRAEGLNHSQLTELDDDIQQHLTRTEERARDEVSGIAAGFIVREALLL